LERSGFRLIQERYVNLDKDEKSDWTRRMQSNDGLTMLEKEDWWKLFDKLPKTTRKNKKRQRVLPTLPVLPTTTLKPPPTPTCNLATTVRADSRFRTRIETIETNLLQKALSKKTVTDY